VTLQCWIWLLRAKTHQNLEDGAQGRVTKWLDGKGYGLFLNPKVSSSFASTIR